MLDQSSLEIARQRITIFLKDRVRALQGEISEIEGRMSARGILTSGITQQAVAAALRAELVTRALAIWGILARVLPEDMAASKDFAVQLKEEVSYAVSTSMADVQAHYDKAIRYLGTKNTMEPIDEIIGDAVGKAHAEIDLALLSRRPSTSSVKGASIPEATPFVDTARLDQVRAIRPLQFDLARLLRLCEELNLSYANGAFMAVAALTRAVIDHVPPIFNCKSFGEVANNYSGSKSFRESMQHLENSARTIGDAHLHVQIRRKEVLPTATQVNFANDLDVLLGEIILILS
jgi:hypothetical protein